MSTPRILITGARGFVGSSVLAHLPEDTDLHAVSRSSLGSHNATWHNADLLDENDCKALIRDVRPTHLVHSAWETKHGEFWEAESNSAWLEAGKALFSAFQAYGGTRIVGCGTCAEYANSLEPLHESEDLAEPASTYGRAKLSLFRALNELSISFAWVRIFYPYGTNEGSARFVPSVCRSLHEQRDARCSSGIQLRNFLEIRDLGAAIAALVSSNIQGPINLGHPVSHKLGYVAELLGEIAGRPDLIKLGALPDRKGEPLVLVPDLSRQTNELKFHPKISIHSGMVDAYRWWKTTTADGQTKAP